MQYDAATIARFWSRVDKRGPDECWDWIGLRLKSGYGRLGRGGKILAHRMSYELAHGVGSAAGMVVRHRCDRPQCVAPHCLVLGTVADNAADRVERNRGAKGSRHSAALLNEALAREIVASTESNVAIAKRLGVSRACVYDVRRGVTWTHATGLAQAPHANRNLPRVPASPGCAPAAPTRSGRRSAA